MIFKEWNSLISTENNIIKEITSSVCEKNEAEFSYFLKQAQDLYHDHEYRSPGKGHSATCTLFSFQR